MKVLILGGCGCMGSSTVRDLIKSDDISRVILADNNTDMANLSQSVRASEKVSILSLDVADYRMLVDAIKDNDVVINDVGPYSKFGVHTVQAAIEAGVSYIDICDDGNVTKEIFKLDEPAKKAGVSICTGFGGSPGFTNILAKHAADKLDEVEEILIPWSVAMNDPIGKAALTQAMSQFIGTVIQYIDGHWVNVPAGSAGEVVLFNEPVGKTEVYYAAHPEPVTLPRYIFGVKNVIGKGGFLPSWVSKMFKEFIKLGFVSDHTITVGNISTSVRELMASVVQQATGFWNQVEEYSLSACNVVVKGREGCNKVTYIYRLIGQGASGTAIPTSICAQMLTRGDIKARGVIAPEGAIDPQRFLLELTKRGVSIKEEKIIENEKVY
jgi:saccharopine dehydrogenase (NAD+, L-lysine-forming)